VLPAPRESIAGCMGMLVWGKDLFAWHKGPRLAATVVRWLLAKASGFGNA
jgi:hypothetical protein